MVRRSVRDLPRWICFVVGAGLVVSSLGLATIPDISGCGTLLSRIVDTSGGWPIRRRCFGLTQDRWELVWWLGVFGVGLGGGTGITLWRRGPGPAGFFRSTAVDLAAVAVPVALLAIIAFEVVDDRIAYVP